MKRAFVGIARAVRAALGQVGLIGWLDRHAARHRGVLWVRSWLAIYDLHDLARLDVPWWTFKAADEVAAFLARRPDARVLEWGSGASTLWLARRASHVTAIEHDAGWGSEVESLAPAHVTVLVQPPEPSSTPAVPSAKPGFQGLDFSRYVSRIHDVGGLFDLIVVDGRAREACLEEALPHLAPGGLIVFDNVDRQRYLDAMTRATALQVTITRGLTPCLPYPTRTALLRVRPQ